MTKKKKKKGPKGLPRLKDSSVPAFARAAYLVLSTRHFTKAVGLLSHANFSQLCVGASTGATGSSVVLECRIRGLGLTYGGGGMLKERMGPSSDGLSLLSSCGSVMPSCGGTLLLMATPVLPHGSNLQRADEVTTRQQRGPPGDGHAHRRPRHIGSGPPPRPPRSSPGRPRILLRASCIVPASSQSFGVCACALRRMGRGGGGCMRLLVCAVPCEACHCLVRWACHCAFLQERGPLTRKGGQRWSPAPATGGGHVQGRTPTPPSAAPPPPPAHSPSDPQTYDNGEEQVFRSVCILRCVLDAFAGLCVCRNALFCCLEMGNGKTPVCVYDRPIVWSQKCSELDGALETACNKEQAGKMWTPPPLPPPLGVRPRFVPYCQ